MNFRDREKKRLRLRKVELFSAGACQPGLYRNKRYDFCLHEDYSQENLHMSIREDGITYFKERKIRWHDAIKGRPSNHLCCSQSSCLNFWLPFLHAPKELATVLRALGYDVAVMLPFYLDKKLPAGSYPYVSFEWIGERNYLNEIRSSKVAPNGGRSRGANFTSLDFAFRFRRTDGRIQIVAGEWKYTECYSKNVNLRFSRSNIDRLDRIYRKHLEQPDCQIKDSVSVEDLFFDPFDQLMRQQLLCTTMEREQEMGAKIVSLLHIAPKANRELLNRVTSPRLKAIGSDIHKIWTALTVADRFVGITVETLLPLVCQFVPTPESTDYLQLRYGDMH